LTNGFLNGEVWTTVLRSQFCDAMAAPSIVLGGVCRSTTAALRIHRLGADSAKNLWE